ncbi:hypothetical protein ACLMJK_009287 [Lecanora helva]
MTLCADVLRHLMVLEDIDHVNLHERLSNLVYGERKSACTNMVRLPFKLPTERFHILNIHLERLPSAFSGAQGATRWSNKDLDPVRRENRKWGIAALIAYWISDAFNSINLELGSSILAIGLSWKDAIGTVALGFLIISVVINLNGATGALYHAPFPVLARAGWGFWGSYVAIVSRIILALCWFAVFTANGGTFVQVMITAIWPSFGKLKNTIPADQGITSAGMVSFFIFWLIELPFLYMSPNSLRWLFITKSIIVPIAYIAILIWAFRTTGGTGGPLLASDAKATVTGSTYSYAWLSSMTSMSGTFSTISVNMPDFTRYTKSNVRWMWLYVPMLPTIFTFVAFIGIAATSAGQEKYGSLDWNTADLIGHWDNRACQFFVGFACALAALGSNISANSISAANDLAAISPSYFNIRRGQLTCAFFAWVLVPWKILATASGFLNFMSAYSIFFGPIAAILVLDFWWLHRAKYDVVALYHPDSIYRYAYGINFRALAAFIVGIAPNFPGFVNSINSSIDVGVGKRPYTFAYILGFVITSLVYAVLSSIWKPTRSLIEKAVLPDEVYDGKIEVEGSEEVGETSQGMEKGSHLRGA